jgi:hypothetical protein
LSTYKGVCRETVSLRASACIEVDGGGFENIASFDGDMYLQKLSVLFMNNKSRPGEVVQEFSFIPYMDFVRFLGYTIYSPK